MSTDNTDPYPKSDMSNGREYPVPAEYRATTPQWWARNCYDRLRSDLYAAASNELTPGAVVVLDMSALMNAVLTTGRDPLDGADPLTIRELVSAHTILNGTGGDLSGLTPTATGDRYAAYYIGDDMVTVTATPTVEDAPDATETDNLPDTLDDLYTHLLAADRLLSYSLSDTLRAIADSAQSVDPAGLRRLAVAVEDAMRPVRELRHMLYVCDTGNLHQGGGHRAH